LYLNFFLAHLSKAQVSLCRGGASVVRRPSFVVRRPSTFSFKQLLLKNHWTKFNQTWQEVSLEDGH